MGPPASSSKPHEMINISNEWINISNRWDSELPLLWCLSGILSSLNCSILSLVASYGIDAWTAQVSSTLEWPGQSTPEWSSTTKGPHCLKKLLGPHHWKLASKLFISSSQYFRRTPPCPEADNVRLLLHPLIGASYQLSCTSGATITNFKLHSHRSPMKRLIEPSGGKQ